MAMTFRVNIETMSPLKGMPPLTPTLGGEIDALKTTLSTWFPNKFNSNYVLKNGDEIVVSGEKAIYLRDTYTTGEYKILDYVGGSALP